MSSLPARLVGKAPVAPADVRLETVTIADLHDCQCRWPIGDLGTREFRYCGALRADKRYCEEHIALGRGVREPRPARTPIRVSRLMLT